MPTPPQKTTRRNAFEEADDILKDNAGAGYIRKATNSEIVANDVTSGRMPKARNLSGAGREVMKAGGSILSGLLGKSK